MVDATDPLKTESKGKKGATSRKVLIYGGAVASIVAVWYIWKQHDASTAATAAATPAADTSGSGGTDPETGLPLAAGSGSLSDVTGNSAADIASFLANVDPNSPTGETYEQEISNGTLASSFLSEVDPNSPTGQTYEEEITAGHLPGDVPVTSPGGSATTTAQSTWNNGLVAALEAGGFTAAQAQNYINEYTNKQSISSLPGAKIISAYVSGTGGLPPNSGTTVLPIVAKAGTGTAGTGSAKTTDTINLGSSESSAEQITAENLAADQKAAKTKSGDTAANTAAIKKLEARETALKK
jgi:hypothetical protein